jgi:hypothetical protein
MSEDDVTESEEWEDVPGERPEDEVLTPIDLESIDSMVDDWFKHRDAHRAPSKRKWDPGV